MRERVAVGMAVALIAGCSSGTSGKGSSSGGSLGSSSSGSSGGSTGGMMGSASYQQFCQSYPQAVCATYQACALLDPSSNCSAAASQIDCDAGAYYAYDATEGAACLALLSSVATTTSACATTEVFGIEPDGGAPCAAAVQPGVPFGGACVASAGQCIPPPDAGLIFCLDGPSSCAGTCGVSAPNGALCQLGGCANGFCDFAADLCEPYVSLGGECTGALNACDPAVGYCIFPPDAGYSRQFCTPLVASGAPCFIDGCVAGSYCGSPDGGIFATCQPQVTVGAACDANAVGMCPSGSLCFQGTCSASPAPLGSACGTVAGVELFCGAGYCNNAGGGLGTCTAFGAPAANGSSCSATQVCENGYCSGATSTCTAFVAAGGSCTSDVQCAFPTLCQGGTCANPPTAGSPCATGNAFFANGCAYGDYCANGTCAHLGGPGAACSVLAASSSCAEGRCDSTGHCAPFLAPGAICEPTQFQCGPTTTVRTFTDGGQSIRDAACVLPPDGGASICAPECD